MTDKFPAECWTRCTILTLGTLGIVETFQQNMKNVMVQDLLCAKPKEFSEQALQFARAIGKL